MFGGTPSNVAFSFLGERAVEVVTGVNLPMLIKLASWGEGKSLSEIATYDEGLRTAQHLGGERAAAGKQEVIVESAFTIASELGLHARPAGEFAALAGKFTSEVSVARAGTQDWVSGRSVLSLLSLAASQGTELHLRAEGADAEAALAALGALLTRPHAG